MQETKYLDNFNKPTMYFLGVSTEKSFIWRVFPNWMKLLGVQLDLVGISLPLDVKPIEYQHIIEHIKNNENIQGALVTSHKVRLFEATNQYFDYLDKYANIFGEICAIYKRDGYLCGDASDIYSVASALKAFFPPSHWHNYCDAEVCILGCGGAGVSLAAHFLSENSNSNPKNVIMTEVQNGRASRVSELLNKLNYSRHLSVIVASDNEVNSSIVSGLEPGSLVVNATGMGKDLPGSPISQDVFFPSDGFVWDFNYRGKLSFLRQAEKQSALRHIHIEDGWKYFLNGWTEVISRVTHSKINVSCFNQMAEIATFINGRT